MIKGGFIHFFFQEFLDVILKLLQNSGRFLNYDLILFCKEYTHLVALRDFLYLSQNAPIGENFMLSDNKKMEGNK